MRKRTSLDRLILGSSSTQILSSPSTTPPRSLASVQAPRPRPPSAPVAEKTIHIEIFEGERNVPLDFDILTRRPKVVHASRTTSSRSRASASSNILSVGMSQGMQMDESLRLLPSSVIFATHTEVIQNFLISPSSCGIQLTSETSDQGCLCSSR